MSYSFSAKGPTKTDAILDAEEKFAKVVEQMPVHGKDQSEVLAHMRNLVRLADEPGADEEVYISMNGYMSVVNESDGAIQKVRTVSASCSVSLARKNPA